MSWIITRRSTGEVIGEFYDYRNVARFNPEKVLIETALEHLQRINKQIIGVELKDDAHIIEIAKILGGKEGTINGITYRAVKVKQNTVL